VNVQQLRYIRETARRGFNLTEAADALHTSQSGISKQIRLLEFELGVEVFVRKGKRILGLTRAGEGAVEVIERALLEIDNLKRHAADYSVADGGRLIVSTTHNQARYTLPSVIEAFAREFPTVQVELRQVTAQQAAQSVLRGDSDVAIATTALAEAPGLVSFDCFSWRHVVVAPDGHPLTRTRAPSLAAIAAYPIITYSPEFTGRSQIDAAFAGAGLTLDVRLTAMDADVIKTYVARGLGVGIVAETAIEDGDYVKKLDGSDTLFAPSRTKVALQRGALLRSHAYRFIELFAPHLRASLVRRASLGPVGAKPLTEEERTLLSQTPDFTALYRQAAAQKHAAA
jgi:DNA-binding transcriptional LysR family regulator